MDDPPNAVPGTFRSANKNDHNPVSKANNQIPDTDPDDERSRNFEAQHELMKRDIREHIRTRREALRQNHLDLTRRFTDDTENMQGRRSAGSLFPNEIWRMIFDYLTNDADTLLRCTLTCSLFEEILGKSRQFFLFRKIVPFLVDHATNEDILNCRLVCKKWCSGYDRAVENAHLLRESEAPYTKAPNYWHLPSYNPIRFLVAENCGFGIGDVEELREIKSHPRNPFIGRKIFVQWKVSTTDLAMTTEPRVRQVYSEFGHHAFHAELRSDRFFYPSSNYLSLICHMLKACKSVKRINLAIDNCDIINEQLTEAELYFNPNDIPSCPHLVSLTFPVVRTGRLTDAGAATQDALVRRFSSQLKVCQVTFWNEDFYSRLDWKNLQSLTILGSVICLENFAQMDAPRLMDLIFQIGNSSVPQFSKLMRVLNSFPALTDLLLIFSKDFSGFDDNELIRNEHTLLTTWSRTITNLKLRLHGNQESTLSFDFLIYFPFLKQLCFRTRNWKRLKGNAHGAKNYIKLTPFISQSWTVFASNVNAIYRSNIWQVLMRLQYLEFFRDYQELECNRWSYEKFQEMEI